MSLNHIELKTRTSKKFVSDTISFEQTRVIVTINGVKLFESDTDHYNCTQQELLDKALEFISNVRLAFGTTGNTFTIKCGTY